MLTRVVITGIGVVTPIGIGKDDFWSNLISGKCGISEIGRFDVSQFPIKRAGEIKNFKSEEFISRNFSKKIGRASQLAIAAAKIAMDDSGLNLKKIESENVGVIMGTTMGEIQSLELIDKYWIGKGEDEVYVSHVFEYPVCNLSDNIGYYFSFHGRNYVIPTACAAGNYSIGYAFDLIMSGKEKIMLAGGADTLSRIAFTGFSRLFAMAPEKVQPFDKNRRGMMIGEGAAVVIIESLNSAEKRNAKIYGEILGYGLSCDAHHMTIPTEQGMANVMEGAIKNSGVRKEDVGYISAHGTGTGPNDKTETSAIKKVFGDLVKNIPISSIKSMLGHTMGTASALEAIACCLAMEEGIMPPTINYETPDPECNIDCVPNKARKKEVNVCLNNSFAFGGNNACLVLKKFKH